MHKVFKFDLRTIKLILVGAVCVSAAIFIFAMPDEIKKGAVDGLLISTETVIPSLFPFSVLAYFMFDSGIFGLFEKIFDPAAKLLLGLNGKEFSCLLMSMLAGYPVGARLIANRHDAGEIGEPRAKMLLCYSVNAGPPFIITAVGSGMLHSEKIGVVLLSSHIFASLVLCRISTLFFPKSAAAVQKNRTQKPIADCFVDAVSTASKSMFSICGWVVLFSSLRPVLTRTLPSVSANFLLPMFEVTSGLAYGSFSIPEVAFFLGFSGFSVIFQVMSGAKSFKPRFLTVVFSRLAHGALSFLFCKLYLYFFPFYTQTVSNGQSPVFSPNNIAVPAAAALVLTLCVFYGFVRQSEDKLKRQTA